MQTRNASTLGTYTYMMKIELGRIQLSTDTCINIATPVKNDHHPCISPLDFGAASF